MSALTIVKIAIILVTLAVAVVLAVLVKKKKLNRMLTVVSLLAVSLVSASAFLAVSFLEKPEFAVIGKTEMVLPVFSEYEDPGATAFFRNKNLSDRIAISGQVDTSVVGEYDIEYNFSLRGHYYYAVRRVIVEDKTAPQIVLSGEQAVTVSSLDFYNEAGFTATDNYDGDISGAVTTSTETVSDGKYKIVYTVTDSSGNIATSYRDIEVKDIVKPVIALNSERYISVAKDSTFSYPNVTATDDLDGDISGQITLSGSVDTAVSGVQNITYSVTDRAGNTTSENIQVNVYVPDDPSLSRIYLTFDDGPSDNVTPQILDVLKANDVKATFFINGYSEDKLPLINRIISEGHTLGLHGMSHDYAAVYTSLDACVENFNSLREQLLIHTGYNAEILRFPGGSSNVVSKKYCSGVVTQAVKKLTEQGWRYFDWNVDSGDADGNMSKNYIVNNIKKQLKIGRANVVLMHDFKTKGTTAQALQEIIDYGKSGGYVFSAINESTPDIHHNIAN